ncbi:Uu.00g060400.m01.CDS01 [Anthostomella pinea]|uniref:Uu.00g060400.m01.CDS01 n=1 Tax=Anthostomella pinea TaxID=933095 RepID=A0AAI8VS99_9PEZI|nr:Uu.00g060400.m01.CDS01 [Anthostomella pinea]
MSTARSEHLPIGYPPKSANGQRSTSPNTNSNISPIESSGASATRSPFGMSGTLNPTGKMAGNTRSGAGSPSHDTAGSSRLFSKRAREIQAQEGVPGMPVNLWGGPPTSGNSTPLRENIPESPTDGFPDFAPLPTPDSLPSTRRARAGTVPSRFPANGVLNASAPQSQSSRPTPSQSPFNKTPSPGLAENTDAARASTLLSRLRAGSMPQRSPFAHGPGSSSPFGPSVFSTWNPTGRDRGNTLASIASVGSNGPSSPAQSAMSKDGPGDNDVHMRTLDYLGLAETPQQPLAQLAYPPGFADLSKQANRFRSYSVNNKDKYADEEDDGYDDESLALESQYAVHLNLQDQLAATNAAIHSHNLAVQSLQSFASQAATRPRARTAGVLELQGAGSRLMRNYYPTPSRLDSSITAAELRLPDSKDFDDLPTAVAAMNLGRSNSRNNNLLTAEEAGLEGPTSALWLGSIPTSTTTSTLTEMFKSYGTIASARVLTHKNCGFVNFERIDSAISAKASMNGKEIFPGAGPIRINFAKPPSASNTPGHDGVFPSPSPDPFAKGQDAAGSNAAGLTTDSAGAVSNPSNVAPALAPLHEMTGDILQIVKSFGATDEDTYRISHSLQQAIQFNAFVDEIPPIREPTHTRVHDAPKLRDIRKRIDNQSLSQAEIENMAVDMLPEIAELSSDYLGNTVVQKLFEHCSDDLRDAMLAEIAPHMAEIGVHKNGTWAAQKIIDVCKTPHQMSLIVENLRPYTISLFLDQYGNYVLQGCLKFGSPFNDFIFETMLNRMWDVSQGRYGARAMRACLESHHATKEQQKMLAAAIALHSVQLATNANGALLLTWLLDTCTFPQRRNVLAPQLVPYLVHLCTHKVAYLTVLKVINQKAEADARDTILKALFFTPKDHVLEAILSDHACGATLIFKVLTTPFFDESIRSQVVENVKNVLVRIKAQPNQGYKRLMDEVGLSTRNGGGGGSRDHSVGHSASNERQRPASRHAQANAAAVQQNSQYGNQYLNPLNPASTPQNFDMGGYAVPRSESVEPPMPPYQAYGHQGPMFNGANGSMAPVNLQQLQYQQNMLSRGAPPMNNYYPPMQAGFGGYNSPSPSMDQYRGQNVANGSPNQPPGAPAGFAPPGFGMNMGMGGYGYGNGMQNMPYMQEQPVNTRRGRVGQSRRSPRP